MSLQIRKITYQLKENQNKTIVSEKIRLSQMTQFCKLYNKDTDCYFWRPQP